VILFYQHFQKTIIFTTQR